MYYLYFIILIFIIFSGMYYFRCITYKRKKFLNKYNKGKKHCGNYKNINLYNRSYDILPLQDLYDYKKLDDYNQQTLSNIKKFQDWKESGGMNSTIIPHKDYHIETVNNTITDINSNKVFNKFDLKKNIYNKINNIDSLEKCQVPTLNTEQCYKSKEFECPIVNGTYLQCTNNYIPKPDQYNADCSNRTFDMVPYPWKISENCYYNSINFDRQKKYEKVKFV